MRFIAPILLACSTAAAQHGTFLTLSGTVNPVLHRVNPQSGEVAESRPITGHEALLGGMAYDGEGVIYCIDGFDDAHSDRLFRISLATGIGSVVGNTGFNWSRRCVHATGPGGMHAIGDNRLYTISAATGAANFVADISGPAVLDQVTAIASIATGVWTVYITDTGNTDLFTLNTFNGQATWIGSLGGSDDPFVDLAVVSGSQLLGLRASGGIYRIDTLSATQTLVLTSGYSALDGAGNVGPWCYANCDRSTGYPFLTANDFMCFVSKWNSGTQYADCDSTSSLTYKDFYCYSIAFDFGCY